MPKIQLNECQYHYEIYGKGPETILFSHGLLWSSKMFHKQIDFLKDRYKIVAYDHRGQGQSQITASGYDMDELFADVLLLIEKLQLGKVHFAGLSMGGFIGLRLAARRPDLCKSLILMETSALPEPNKLKYTLLTYLVKLFGVGAVKGPVMNIMYGDKFLIDPKRKDERKLWTNELLKNKSSIVKAVNGVIHRKGVEDELHKIKCPVLIMVGTQDKATVPAKAEFMNDKIKGSRLRYIRGAGHSSSIEEADQVNAAIDDFLKKFKRRTGA